jgi:hypothetical protein
MEILLMVLISNIKIINLLLQLIIDDMKIKNFLYTTTILDKTLIDNYFLIK